MKNMKVNESKDKSDVPWLIERRGIDPLCRVVLVEPLIPENTGNISRTCVATGSELHLVDPMGFELSESRVRRAGLDYWKDLAWSRHPSYQAWREGEAASQIPRGRVFFIETGAPRTIYDAEFQRGDWIVFGKETSGLDRSIMEENDAHAWSIPMPGTTRSLNLSNAVAVVVFEVLRQTLRNSALG